jgi:hypothetical protein
MNTIQSLVESANPWKSLQGDAARLANKWSKTGLLEGLGEDVNKNNMALMLENQAKQLVIETSQTGVQSSFSSGTSGENWAGIALPLVRKVFGSIAAKEFVSVQPMNLPSGLVFFLDFQYGTTKNPFTTGGSLYGTRNASSTTTPFANTAPAGGLYGGGRFAYTTNQFTQSNVSANATTASGYVSSSATNIAGIATAIWAGLGYDSDLSASVASGNIWRLTVNTMGAVSGTLDPDAVRAFTVSASNNGGLTTNIAPSNVLSNYTTFNGTDTLTFYLSGSTVDNAGANTNITLFYNKKTADNARGDFEQGQLYATGSEVGFDGTNIAIPEINISMQSQAITAKTKKLKAAWTPEFAQDLNAYQNLDAEAELTNIMSEYISLEIDLEILDMLIEDVPASNIEYWSAVNNVVATSTTAPTASLGFYNTQGAWFQTLGTKINKLSNKIHQLTLRGGANFMVVSPTVSTILESIPGFAANSNGAEDMEYAFGVQKAGQFNSRYTVYKNPYMTENTILVGFRGKQFLEAGAVFAPYIPLIMTPLIYDPVNFTPRKGLLTRFAKKMLRPEFYGKVYIAGLNTL